MTRQRWTTAVLTVLILTLVLWGPVPASGGGREGGTELVDGLGADVGSAVLDEDALRAVPPEIADPLHGQADGAIADFGHRPAFQVHGEDQPPRPPRVAVAEMSVEAIGLLLPRGQVAGNGFNVRQAEYLRPRQRRLRLAQKADRLGDVDAAMPAGGPGDPDEPIIGPSFER